MSSDLRISGTRPISPSFSEPLQPLSLEFDSNGPTLVSLEIVDFQSKTWDHPVLFFTDNTQDNLSELKATFPRAKSGLYILKLKFSDCSNTMEEFVQIPKNSTLKLSVEERNNVVELNFHDSCKRVTAAEAEEILKKSVFN